MAYYNFPRSEEGRIIEVEFCKDFSRYLEKKRRLNPTGENCYMDKRGWITRDEDKIIAAQRIWKDRVYSPPGTPFEKRGYMYRKTMENFVSRQR